MSDVLRHAAHLLAVHLDDAPYAVAGVVSERLSTMRVHFLEPATGDEQHRVLDLLLAELPMHVAVAASERVERP